MPSNRPTVVPRFSHDAAIEKIVSDRMRNVRNKNSKPELRVRKALHALGYRFRVHRRDLPGTPDIVLSKHHQVIFVHGCFWHQHPGCKHAKQPSLRTAYWLPKLERTKARDAEKANALSNLGWRVLTIWECETQASESLLALLRERISS